MKHILLITNNLQQASFRERVGWLPAKLASRGFDIKVEVRPQSFLARNRLFRSAGGFDAVLLQRKLLDPSDARLLRRCAKRIIYDVDDAVMYHAHSVGWFSRWRTRRRFKASSAIFDHVIAGNEYLADIFRAEGCATTVLPNAVDPAFYPVKAHGSTSSPLLVWIGSHSTLPYLQAELASLAQAARSVPGLRLRVIADAAPTNTALPIDFVPWSLQTFAQSLSQADIGIAPTPANPWTIGKCGFKILQYMAAGLPVVASPVGANAVLVHPGQTGFLPATSADWTRDIIRLAGDGDLRRQMGAAARGLVERHYTLDTAADVWAEILSM